MLQVADTVSACRVGNLSSAKHGCGRFAYPSRRSPLSGPGRVQAECGVGDVQLWLTRGGDRRRCALASLPARHALHARDPDQRGRKAGQLCTLPLLRLGAGADQGAVGMAEVLLWLGSRQDAHLALQGLPAGHDGDLGEKNKLKLPAQVCYDKDYVRPFACKLQRYTSKICNFQIFETLNLHQVFNISRF